MNWHFSEEETQMANIHVKLSHTSNQGYAN